MLDNPSYQVVDTSDPHWVAKLSFASLVKKMTEKGDPESAAFYQEQLDRLNGVSDTLF